MRSKLEFAATLEKFLNAVYEINNRIDGNHKKKLQVKGLKKRIRLFDDHGVFCFIDSEGNIYKAATWDRPAKHIRGNIFSDQNGIEAIDQHQYGSIRYLR